MYRFKYVGGVHDWVSPPTENAVLFVAHPDDDTLFFHTFIKNNKPYVCLMTAGWRLRRLLCFIKAMKYYGVRYRVYDFDTKDKRENLIKNKIAKILSVGKFSIIATHNLEGEYGHEMHSRLHKCVQSVVNGTIYCPVSSEKIGDYPLAKEIVKEKENIFNTIYVTEKYVLEWCSEWVMNEQLECVSVCEGKDCANTKEKYKSYL